MRQSINIYHSGTVHDNTHLAMRCENGVWADSFGGLFSREHQEILSAIAGGRLNFIKLNNQHYSNFIIIKRSFK